MALQKTTKRRPTPMNAVWNEYPFTCPVCKRNWAIKHIRICRNDGTWVCQKCRDAVLQRTVRNPGKIIGVPPESSCHTCHAPMGKRRAVVNTFGNIVHYRCPKKHRPPS